MDQPLGVLQHLGDDLLGATHFPQDVGMHAAAPVGQVVGAARLDQGAVNGVGDQFLVPVPPGAAVVELRNRSSRFIVAVGVHRAERADAAAGCPVPGGNAVRDRHALAAFNQRKNIEAAHPNRIDRLHCPLSLAGSMCASAAVVAIPESAKSRAMPWTH